MTDKLDKVQDIGKEDRAIGKRLGEIGLIPESDLTTEVRAEQLTLRQRSPVVKGLLQEAIDEQRAEQNKGLTLDTADTELRQLTKTGQCRRRNFRHRRAAHDDRRNCRDSTALQAEQQSNSRRDAADRRAGRCHGFRGPLPTPHKPKW